MAIKEISHKLAELQGWKAHTWDYEPLLDMWFYKPATDKENEIPIMPVADWNPLENRGQAMNCLLEILKFWDKLNVNTNLERMKNECLSDA